MKKLVFLVVIVVLIFVGIKLWQKNETKKTETDKANVLLIADALVNAFDNNTAELTWNDTVRTRHIFTIDFIYQVEGTTQDAPYYKAVRNLLGDDFPRKLETNQNDILAVVNPWSRHVELYVNSQDNKNMLYPDMIYDLDNTY